MQIELKDANDTCLSSIQTWHQLLTSSIMWRDDVIPPNKRLTRV